MLSMSAEVFNDPNRIWILYQNNNKQCKIIVHTRTWSWAAVAVSREQMFKEAFNISKEASLSPGGCSQQQERDHQRQ